MNSFLLLLLVSFYSLLLGGFVATALEDSRPFNSDRKFKEFSAQRGCDVAEGVFVC
jgi:hypothetical protein